jgi:nitroreductase
MDMRWQKAIPARTSRRSYLPGDIPADIQQEIERILSNARVSLLGTQIGFELVSKYSEENSRLKLGTYGFITGARYYIVGQVQAGIKAFIDYGYALEKIILQLTLLKLGTCWLGGTFDRGEFARAVNLKEGMVIPAITPVGIPTDGRSIGDRLIRFGAGSHARKPWEALFFNENQGSTLSRKEAGEKAAVILDMVRIAPSASNLQPWRIIKHADVFSLYLQRKAAYQGRFGGIDLQMIDMGIAICHFDLTARELGIVPEWMEAGQYKEVDGWEYIISVKI